MTDAGGLGRAFLFDEADLAANRQGRLSAEQARLFANVARYSRSRTRIMVPLFLGLLAGTVVLAVATSQPADLLPVIGVVGGMGLFLVLLVGFFARRTSRDAAVQAAGQVLSVAGPWEHDSSLDGTWYIRIQGVRFGVDLTGFEALRDGIAYRAYFLPTPSAATLLSIEES